jgi:hypothetical protein
MQNRREKAECMKSRYLYLAASVAFLVGAVVEFRSPRALTAAILDAIAGVVFLYLAWSPQKMRVKPPE